MVTVAKAFTWKNAAKESHETSYLWGNYFDEFIEKTELPHFTMKPFTTTFHTCFQNLQKEIPKIKQNLKL